MHPPEGDPLALIPKHAPRRVHVAGRRLQEPAAPLVSLAQNVFDGLTDRGVVYTEHQQRRGYLDGVVLIGEGGLEDHRVVPARDHRLRARYLLRGLLLLEHSCLVNDLTVEDRHMDLSLLLLLLRLLDGS